MSSRTDPHRVDPRSREELLAAAIQFASELGPESERLLSLEEVQVRVLWKNSNGRPLEDAVLAEIYDAAAKHGDLAGEFLNHFLNDLARVGSALLSNPTRRLHDTQDLVHSVVGNLWQDVPDFRYRSRSEFVMFLVQRMRWKAGSYFRRSRTKARRDDLRFDDVLRISQVFDARARNPRSIVSSEESWERLAFVLTLLPPDDSMILRQLILKGRSVATVAESLEITEEQVRGRLRRARARACELLCQNR